VNHLHGTAEDHDSAVVDDALFAVARWIQNQSGTSLSKMEGADHFQFQFPHIDIESTTAGSCKAT
jgi:hypothetical protein